jgi:hypothetical protein
MKMITVMDFVVVSMVVVVVNMVWWWKSSLHCKFQQGSLISI